MNGAPEKLRRIALYCEADEQGSMLARELQRTRAEVRRIWPIPDRIGDDVDLVMAEYEPDLAARLAWMPGEPTAALVVLLSQSGQFDLRRLQAATPDAVLHRPYSHQAVRAAVMLAMDHWSYGRRQRTRIARLDENLKSLREIERAKLLLMASKRVGEAEAYSLLRAAAMRRGITVAALAASLVDNMQGPA